MDDDQLGDLDQFGHMNNADDGQNVPQPQQGQVRECKVCYGNVDASGHRMEGSDIRVEYNYFCDCRGTQGYMCVTCLNLVYPRYPNGCHECGVWRNCRPVRSTMSCEQYFDWFVRNYYWRIYDVLKYVHIVVVIVAIQTHLEVVLAMIGTDLVVKEHHIPRWVNLILIAVLFQVLVLLYILTVPMIIYCIIIPITFVGHKLLGGIFAPIVGAEPT